MFLIGASALESVRTCSCGGIQNRNLHGLATASLARFTLAIRRNALDCLFAVLIILFISGTTFTNPLASTYLLELPKHAEFQFLSTLSTITETKKVSLQQILIMATGSIEMGLVCMVGLTLGQFGTLFWQSGLALLRSLVCLISSLETGRYFTPHRCCGLALHSSFSVWNIRPCTAFYNNGRNTGTEASDPCLCHHRDCGHLGKFCILLCPKACIYQAGSGWVCPLGTNGTNPVTDSGNVVGLRLHLTFP